VWLETEVIEMIEIIGMIVHGAAIVAHAYMLYVAFMIQCDNCKVFNMTGMFMNISLFTVYATQAS
jgi:hypothetical protein